MPTGYTNKIKDGISFEKYALGCARAFGVLMHMRDDSADADIPKVIVVDEYHKEELDKRIEELKVLKNTDHLVLITQFVDEKNNDKKRYLDRLKENKDLRKKYNDMRKMARKFKPPTEEHKEYKEFMIKQIEDSISCDCNDSYYTEQLRIIDGREFDRWKEEKTNDLEADIQYHTEEYEKSVNLAGEKTAWLSELRKAIGEVG